MKKSKMLSLTLAGVLAASSLLAGTYAWKSVSQKAKNKVKQTVNPGARLHDDFDFNANGNKDVYVENFTSADDSGVAVYARVRLDEYLEIGTKAGETSSDKNVKVIQNAGTGTTPQFADESTWTTYQWEREKIIEGGNHAPVKAKEPSEFRKYFLWNQDENSSYKYDGVAYYMPTFNKDKDSLAADINGTLEGKDGTGANPYDDNIVYAAGETVKNIAIYDADDDEKDDAATVDLEAIVNAMTKQTTKKLKSGDNVTERTWDSTKLTGTTIKAGGKTYEINVVKDSSSNIEYVDVALDPSQTTKYNVRLKEETHTAKATRSDGDIMSMEQWKTDGCNPGDYWVYDTDGWVYWANGIEPGETTSLLLDKIEPRKDAALEEEYYAINVVAQFCTKNEDGEWTDFDAEGAPSADATQLLNNVFGVPYAKYEVLITADATSVAQEESCNLNTVVRSAAETVTPDISWEVSRADGEPVDEDTKFTYSATGKKQAKLTVGLGEKTGELIVTATHMDEAGCYGVEKIKITVTECQKLIDIRENVRTAAAGVTTGKYNASAKVTIDGQEWYVIAKNADNTQALLYAAKSLDYDGKGIYQWKDAFGNTNQWINSNIRKYLNDAAIYAGNSFKDRYPCSYALAEETEIYTRTSVDANTRIDKKDFTMTEDKVFLLSQADFCADFWGRFDKVNQIYTVKGAQKYDYTVLDADGNGVKLWSDASDEQKKDLNGQWVWLRSPIGEEIVVADLGSSGAFDAAYCTSDLGGIRPAFWVDISK